ncbi:MAG: DNA internalization-related competence protein ComEC/Rec2 [Roseburia sp.]|nr:DNA internalization-related competence protein ComEC/Rec2 [Roseburia sp.]
MVTRRPLLIIFTGMIAFICIWYHFSGDDSAGTLENVPVECVGQIDEIQMKTSGKVLVLSDAQARNTDMNKTIEIEKILIYDFSENNLFSHSRVGNIVRVQGKYSTFQKASNPGEFDEYAYYTGKGISGRVLASSFEVKDAGYDPVRHGLYMLRQRAMENLRSVMTDEDAGVLGAMILGDKTFLSAETKELYQQSGVGHMLAISGLHISLIGAGLFFFLRSYVLPMKKAVIVTVVFLLLYGQFTGFPVATTRAVLMMCCALFARYVGRSYDALSAISLSGIVTLLQEPAQLFQCGFLLSYTAIAGILLFSPVWERLDDRKPFLKTVVSGISVFFITLPVMLWFFYEICPYSVAANLILLPFLSLLIGVGILGCAVTFFWQAGGGFLLSTAHYILKFYEFVCSLIERLPFSRMIVGRPSLFLIVAYYAVLVLIVYFYMKCEKGKGITCFAIGGMALCGILLFFPPQMGFLYTQLDVGQGDCACIFYGDKTYLIDGGSSSENEIGKYTLQKFLKFYGRDHIDQIFITHSDADHTNGILELVTNQSKWGIRIGSIVMPEIQKKDAGYLALIRTFQEYNTKVFQMKRGDHFSSGELSVKCLHPFPDYEWESENDYSLTLELSYRELRMLTTGDLEESGEEELDIPEEKYDILKVGHHGSKTSSSEEFLAQTSPENAFISAGRNNRYGHPAEVTLDKLNAAGARIWSTAEQGAIFAECDERGKRIYSFWE